MTELGNSISQAVRVISNGGVLIYPTEAVFGMGCDYTNQQAVLKLLALKQRQVDKGLILIASHIQQILPLIKPKERSNLARALKTWPGHHTWVFPKTNKVPSWISGDFDTVAVRVSKHPVVKSLCDTLGSALVSTSANFSGKDTPDSCMSLKDCWGHQVDYYLDLPLGNESNPSAIHLATDGSKIR